MTDNGTVTIAIDELAKRDAEIWSLRAEIARLRAEKIEQEQEWAAVCAERERPLRAEIEWLTALAGHDVVPLRPDTLMAVDARSEITGLSRESIVNAILTAAFSFEQEDLDRIVRRGNSV